MSVLAGLLLSGFGAPAGAVPAGRFDAGAIGENAPFVDEQVLYKQGDFGYACFRIPGVVRATNGMLLAFAEGRVKDCGDDGQRIDGVDRFRGTLDEVRVYRRALTATELDLVQRRNLPVGGELGLRLPFDNVS